ncbi:MAG: thiol:disulfide oxidoreductase [Alphaproteobacteria bacterium]|nr:thiol:disulfide oxidoreductase [Alphaproteobacteria bacterium]
MIDFYYCPAVNGHKVRIALEELGAAYRVMPVDINNGDQFQPAYLKISPNNKIPAMVDHEPPGGGRPLELFESGAMLLYLAEKHGQLLPKDVHGRFDVLKWVFWQVGGLGPMGGQAIHFREYAPEDVPYGKLRYTREIQRLFRVLDRQLAGKRYVAGANYSIADIACYPWIVPHERAGVQIDKFAEVKRWLADIAARPAVQRAYELAKSFQRAPMDEVAKQRLFHQSPESIEREVAARRGAA